MGSSASSAVKLSIVTPVYRLARRLRGLGMGSSSAAKRLRAKDLMDAAVFSLGGFCGVLEGVGSMPVAREMDVAGARDASFAWLRPSAAAALAVLSAVRVPDTRRDDSAAGWGFLRGDGTGETMAASLLRVLIAFLVVRGDVGCWREREVCGEGVRFAVRWEEIRADLRGE